MSVEFAFTMQPDEHGIYDGRELAHELLALAYSLLTPYTEGCPSCTDTLFSVIANGTIEELHQDAAKQGHLSGKLMTTGFNLAARLRQKRISGPPAWRRFSCLAWATRDISTDGGVSAGVAWIGRNPPIDAQNPR